LWAPTTVEVAAIPAISDWTLYVTLCVWASGAFTLATVRLQSWRRMRDAVGASTLIEVRQGIEVRACPGLIEPGVFGFRRPVILLPADIQEQLSTEQLNAVLAHELCHVRRRDNLLAALNMSVEIVFWFHPLVWWLGARVLQEREKACDEEVLQGGGDPHIYASAILNVCKRYIESPVACVSGVSGGSDLKRRIEAILAGAPVTNLSMAKVVVLWISAMALLAIPIAVGVHAQSVQIPKFEVASIKPCKDEPGTRRGGTNSVTPGRLNTGCMALADENHLGLIQRAYVRFANGQANGFQVIPIKGGPSWVRNELFEIIAKAEAGASPAMMQGPMLQRLLEDRFQLRVHRETTEVPVFVLSANKAKLKPAAPGECTPLPGGYPLPPLPAGQRYCKVRIGMQPPAIDAEGSTIAEFSKLLAILLQRPVIDQTGITGSYNIHLDFTPDSATPGLAPATDATAGVSLFTAIQEQLGLKLDKGRGPGEFIVIDAVQKPSAN
jgi:bla regulator protein BlaR1